VRCHKLALHPSKTQFLLFTNSPVVRANPPRIFIDNNDVGSPNIEQLMIEIPNVNLNSDTPAIKFLGVFFDPLLNFKFHIKYVTNKLSRALYFLRTAKNNLTYAARKSLYYSLFHANVIDGIHVWSCTTPSSYSCIFFKTKNGHQNCS
jgi:hypothetical protein